MAKQRQAFLVCALLGPRYLRDKWEEAQFARSNLKHLITSSYPINPKHPNPDPSHPNTLRLLQTETRGNHIHVKTR